jgi:hypothetical protein
LGGGLFWFQGHMFKLRILVKFQQRYKKRHGSLSKPLCAKVLCVGGTSDYRPDSSGQFWELDSHRIPQIVAGDISPRHHRAVGDYLLECLYRPESLLANGPGQKFIARGYHMTGADLCTTGSKKHKLNLSKARSADTISMSLFVDLLEFTPQGKIHPLPACPGKTTTASKTRSIRLSVYRTLRRRLADGGLMTALRPLDPWRLVRRESRRLCDGARTGS